MYSLRWENILNLTKVVLWETLCEESFLWTFDLK